jgi:glutamine synthetase
MADVQSILDMIKENEVEFVDYRFTDPRGKWHHMTMCASAVGEDELEDGILFDGSSIEGWRAINESDMIIKPDLESAVMDPFSAQAQMILTCTVYEPDSGQLYNRDPRATAERAEAYLQSTGIGDTVYFGPEAEFFVFDNVQFDTNSHSTFFQLDDEESPHMNRAELDGGNSGHRPRVKGGYVPVGPVDTGIDLRAEMTTVLKAMGVEAEKHHHEVAPSQHELGVKFNTLVRAADELQIYKYVVHNVAHAYGKTATFMPKPVAGDNGSGMHCHQSIWKDGKATFAGENYAGLSETCLHYIGGIIKHAKALNAFTNPSTNSYKRLVPGFEAPVLLAYSARNRSASCRIPHGSNPKTKRVEVRFPDPVANPYLAFSALLMAGLDGIRNKIHPGDAMDKDLYDLPAEELKDIPTVCGSLREALEALEADNEFLLAGDVFSKDQIEAHINLKWEEVQRFEMMPHPVEFDMYYSA